MITVTTSVVTEVSVRVRVITAGAVVMIVGNNSNTGSNNSDTVINSCD